MRMVDLFAGWGGFTLGARAAGLDVVWASNHWPLAVETHKLNHPDTTHVCQDLRQADWTTLPDFDVLAASPACQGHSSASQPRRRVYHDALRATAFAVVDAADVCHPPALIVENVPSFTQWRLFDWWCQGLRRLGYHLEFHTLTASQLGVPQRRTRLFITGVLSGHRLPPIGPTGPEPPFRPLLERGPQRWTNVAQAPLAVQARIAKGRARHGYSFLTQHTTGHGGVSLDDPIRTITTAPNHWNLVRGDRYRALTSRELARAMGFPDSFVWPTTATVAQVTKGLGNAVCPPVAHRALEALCAVA